MKTSVLITGGMGYIGGRLAEAMLAAGYDVRLGTRNPNQQLSQQFSDCTPVLTDFTSTASLTTACAGAKLVVHLAAMNDADCARDPEAAFEVNVLGTLRLMDAARVAAVNRVLYLSTAHVYRSPLVGRFTEATIPRPSHIYGITHRAAEDLILNGKSAVEGVVIRLANGFGAPSHPAANCWTLLVNDLCRQAVTTQKLLLKSNGMQQRNFVTLADTCRAIQHFLQAPRERVGMGIFNIGARRSMSVLQMTQLIADRCEAILGFCPVINRVPGDDPAPELDYVVEEARSAGFIPADDFSTEIDATLSFCKHAFS